MRWDLRAQAARHGIGTAAELRRRLAAAGLVVSRGKMSGLWAGTPLTVRLDDLDVLCTVLSCATSDLLISEPPPEQRPRPSTPASVSPATEATAPAITPAARTDVAAAGTTPGGAAAAGKRRSEPPV